MSRNIEIYRDTKTNTYSVTLYFRPPMEDMFETATHVAMFEDEADAVALAQRVTAKIRATPFHEKLNGPQDVLDRRYWQGPTSMASPVRWDAEVEPFFVPSQNRVA